MKPPDKDIASLLVAAVLTTGLLWGSDKLTGSLVERQKPEPIASAFADVLPADRFESIVTQNQSVTAYRAFDTQDRLLGFAVTVTIDGYTVHTALSADGSTVCAIRIGETTVPPAAVVNAIHTAENFVKTIM